MIQNECEYQITDASVKRFEKALAQIAKLVKDSEIEPRKLNLQEAATMSILTELREQLSEYDQLKKDKY
jgi:hypothetical protein